jgi:hypothetical protein
MNGAEMDAEARMERKVVAQERQYKRRYKPKVVGRSVFTIQAIQAKRAETVKGGKVDKSCRPRVSVTLLNESLIRFDVGPTLTSCLRSFRSITRAAALKRTL